MIDVQRTADLFETRPTGAHWGRSFEATLDGRPMGTIIQLDVMVDTGWVAYRIGGGIRHSGLTREQALEVLW